MNRPEEESMKMPACLLTLVAAVALALVVTLPGLAGAADMGTPGGTTDPTDTSLPGRYRTAPQPQNAAPGENYRANYFVDYHSNTGNTATQDNDGGQHSATNIRDSIGRRDVQELPRDPFALEMSRFRGEMSVWRR
jgi:ABC-type phosphate transport system substrate-binding protein